MNQEPDDLPNDSTPEREIETLLDVVPSPEFLARVRTRIAQEPATSSWRFHWGFALAGAAAAAVLAMFATSWTASVTRVAAPHQAVTREDVTLEAEPSLARFQPDTPKETGDRAVRSVRLQPDRDVRGGRLQAARPDAAPFADVLFSDEERRALLQLVAAVEDGRVPPFPVAPAVAEEVVPEGTAMMIEPLVIEPLPQIARLEE